MIDIFNPDFKDLIRSLNKFDVEYILIGGYAVIMHGYIRSTSDLDIWINRTEPNYYKLMKAFLDFGLPTTEVNKSSFLHDEEVEVYRFGIEPSAVDLIIGMKALPFELAFNNAKWREIGVDLSVRLINLPELIALKKIAGRQNDLNDLEHLPTGE
jgi:predicted nucleotidyltransferase